MKTTFEASALKIVAILRGLNEHEALSATEVFLKTGIKAVEVTFNSDNAPAIISSLNQNFGKDLAIGAGTVMTADNVIVAKDAGASFILSPHCDPEVIRTTKDESLYSIPGAFTATEVALSLKSGANMVKIFPAGRLGPAYIKDLLGPLNNAPMMAVGAVDLSNCKAFFDAGAKAVGVGSCLANKELIRNGKLGELEKIANEFVQTIQ